MLTAENSQQWLKNFNDKIQKNKAYLSELDTPIGDADHGNNMARGLEAVIEALNAKPSNNLADVFKTTAMSLISKVGGASGPLYGTAFLEMAKAAPNTNDLGGLLDLALKGIEKRGGAKAGDKTLIDVWEPVIKAIKANQLTQKVIDDAVNSTKEMKAIKGRASYLGDRSIGHIDPGAMSSGYLFTALLETEGIL